MITITTVPQVINLNEVNLPVRTPLPARQPPLELVLTSGSMLFKLLVSLVPALDLCSELDFEIIVFLRDTEELSIVSIGISDLLGFVAFPLRTDDCWPDCELVFELC